MQSSFNMVFSTLVPPIYRIKRELRYKVSPVTPVKVFTVRVPQTRHFMPTIMKQFSLG